MRNDVLVGLLVFCMFFLFTKIERRQPNYDILKPRVNNNVVIVDKELQTMVLGIFKDIKTMSANNTIDSNIFVYKNLYMIEKISYSDVNELSDNKAAVTHFWKGIDGKIRIRIIVNYSTRYYPDYIIYSVLLHEIGHAAFKFDHYEKKLDLMNGTCRITYDNYISIIDNFYKDPYKYNILE